jgi:GTP 3',8-cyclase
MKIESLCVRVSNENNLDLLHGGIEGAFFCGGKGCCAAADPAAEPIGFEQIETVIKAMREYGLSKVALTGGEPLVRKDLSVLVGMISKIDGMKEISLMTNATLFVDQAADLKEAGLNRVDICLDTLDPDCYGILTGNPNMENVSNGIAAVEAAGFTPLHFYMQPMEGFNDDEILNFAQFTLNQDTETIFVEREGAMKDNLGKLHPFMSNDDVRARMPGAAEVTEEESPLRYLHFPQSPGKIGLLAPKSERFLKNSHCAVLTTDGRLYLCDGSGRSADLAEALKKGVEAVSKILGEDL